MQVLMDGGMLEVRLVGLVGRLNFPQCVVSTALQRPPFFASAERHSVCNPFTPLGCAKIFPVSASVDSVAVPLFMGRLFLARLVLRTTRRLWVTTCTKSTLAFTKDKNMDHSYSGLLPLGRTRLEQWGRRITISHRSRNSHEAAINFIKHCDSST